MERLKHAVGTVMPYSGYTVQSCSDDRSQIMHTKKHYRLSIENRAVGF